MRTVLSAVAALAFLGIGVEAAQAGATLHIGTGSGTSCVAGGCFVYGSEVNGNTTNTYDIYQTSGGADELSSVLLLFATPNNPTNALSGDPVTGASLAGATVTSGSFTSYGDMKAGDDIYGTASLSPSGSPSDSFTNFSSADLAVLGITAKNFSVYGVTLTISGGTFGGKDALDFTVSDLPLGTFIVAYGDSGKHDYSTPFTQSGLSELSPTPAPEPMSIVLLGTSLLGFGVARRFRRG